jgi:hypothetical protein
MLHKVANCYPLSPQRIYLTRRTDCRSPKLRVFDDVPKIK